MNYLLSVLIEYLLKHSSDEIYDNIKNIVVSFE